MDRWLRQIDIVHHVTAREEYFVPSVIIEVKDVHPPSSEEIRDCLEVGGSTFVIKSAVAVVTKEGVGLIG